MENNKLENGIIRCVDELGRIVIPAEWRRSLGIEAKDAVTISLRDNCVVVEKSKSKCIFCNESENLVEFKSQPICLKCKDQISLSR